jgi:hypothetical protein
MGFSPTSLRKIWYFSIQKRQGFVDRLLWMKQINLGVIPFDFFVNSSSSFDLRFFIDA